MRPAPVPVRGDARGIVDLTGNWLGEYYSADTRRSGSIMFKLEADRDTAYGDVIMVPASAGWRTADSEAWFERRPVRPETRTLVIRFVQVDGNSVSGTIEPYRSPDCGCLLYTTFEGDRRGNRIELQYWVWYPWDAYSPTVPPGELWQVHEGDWESVAVIVDLEGRPLTVGYSQHGKGVRRDWARAPRRGLRPVAYVALGSHANYPTAGTQRLDPRVVDPLFISVIRQNGQAAVDHAGNGRVVRPSLVRVTATTPSWMAFAGGFGEESYLRTPGGQPQAYSATGPKGQHLANISRGSRKDVRDAVQKARGAQSGWASKSGYLRGQILYRMAEMLEGRATTFADLLRSTSGATSPRER